MQSLSLHPTLIDLLRATMRQVEVTLETCPDDPGILALKRQISAAIAELEVAKNSASSSDDSVQEAVLDRI